MKVPEKYQLQTEPFFTFAMSDNVFFTMFTDCHFRFDYIFKYITELFTVLIKMPAKKRLLPRPCPICDKQNGTVQVVIFANEQNIYCRVWHYDPKKYKKIRTKIVSKISCYFDPSEELPKITKYKDPSRGKRSCNFKIEKDFALENMPPLEQDLDDLTSGYFRFRKSINYTNPMFLLQSIKKKGWHKEPTFNELQKIMFKKWGHIKGYLSYPKFWEALEDLERQGKIYSKN